MHDIHAGPLANAATGLNGQLEEELARLARMVAPFDQAIERRFLRHLTAEGHDKLRKAALCAITTGGAARMMGAGRALDEFLEEVQYRGRRLAKLGLAPKDVIGALAEYDQLLDEEISRNKPAAAAALAWVRNQLHFIVVVALNTAFYQVREIESRAFYELFRVEVESRSLDDMLQRFLEILTNFTGAASARVYLPDGNWKGWRNAAALPGPASVEGFGPGTQTKRALAKARCFQIDEETVSMCLDPEWAGGFRTCWSIPFKSEGALRGVMQFLFTKPYDWLPREIDLLLAAAERCWLAAEKARLLEDLAVREEQVRQLANHMVEVEESERRRISRELHDEAGQSLLCVRLQLEMIEQDLAPGDEGTRQKLNEARDLTEHTILEIRRLIAALSPAILEQMGLAAALRQLVGRFRRIHTAEVHLHLPRVLELPKKIEIIVYRLVQEIFNNIAKYSLASGVNLWMESADGCLKLQIEDDGVGFDVEEAFSRRDCFGLSGLRERVALLGGTLVVRSKRRPPQGELNAATANEEDSLVGRVGIERPGTAIHIELPVDATAMEDPRSESARTTTAESERGKRLLRKATRS